ncbi:MAG TPA: hypothetical protein VEY50_11605 [Lysobacter sp.]|nr:hypothetical protein [Lysobacter sp.]
MSERPSNPRSTTDRLQALQELLPELIEERPAPSSFRDYLRRTARSLFADVKDEEERAQCLRAYAEIGLALGVPATLVRDALDQVDPAAPQPPAPLRKAG